MTRTLDASVPRGKIARMPLRLLLPQYWPTWLGLVILRTLSLLPYSWLMALGTGLGRVLRVLLGSFNRTARKNLELCLPDLTPPEREIATLAASGMTTKAIADTLRMSRHTVDGRLRRVFAKLDVTTRVELAGEYARVGN